MNILNKKWPACLLLPVSGLYCMIIFIRNFLYDHHLLPVYHLPSKVISIGNITVGGSGKTPTVAFLANWLKARGKNVAILSRGYGRKSREQLLVCNGKEILVPWEKAGDEPYMLAKQLGVPVLVDADRHRGGAALVKRFHPDVILMDDAFQHRRQKRDADVVTFNGSNPFGNGYLLPAGPLRELKRAVKRADLLWINSHSKQNKKLSLPTEKPVIHALYTERKILAPKKILPIDAINHQNVISVSGIANPDNFENHLKKLGVNIVKSYRYKDHHCYSRIEIQNIQHCAARLNINYIITTEKDWYKITEHSRIEKWICLQIQIKLVNEKKAEKNLQKLLKI